MSWVTQEYKLISNDSGESFELYNLLTDKEEKENVISKHTEIANQMKTDLLAWIESCKKSAVGDDY